MAFLGMHWGQTTGGADAGGSGGSGSKKLTAHQKFQNSLSQLAKSGKGNDQNAVNKLAAQYDKDRAAEGRAHDPTINPNGASKTQIQKWQREANQLTGLLVKGCCRCWRFCSSCYPFNDVYSCCVALGVTAAVKSS